jgi:hypothetical protein
MKTFEELFCEANKCTPAEYPRKVFWKCIYRHAIPIAPLIFLFNSSHFDADRELITHVRGAQKMNQVWEEVRDYFINPKHSGWLRRRANIRISARRLIGLTREYLPSSGSPPPPPSRPQSESSSYEYRSDS